MFYDHSLACISIRLVSWIWLLPSDEFQIYYTIETAKQKMMDSLISHESNEFEMLIRFRFIQRWDDAVN